MQQLKDSPLFFRCFIMYYLFILISDHIGCFHICCVLYHKFLKIVTPGGAMVGVFCLFVPQLRCWCERVRCTGCRGRCRAVLSWTLQPLLTGSCPSNAECVSVSIVYGCCALLLTPGCIKLRTDLC